MAQLLLDRVRDFGGGTDGFRPASAIDPNQCQDMVNMIVRDNYECRTRPGADQLDDAGCSFNTNVGGINFTTTGQGWTLGAIGWLPNPWPTSFPSGWNPNDSAFCVMLGPFTIGGYYVYITGNESYLIDQDGNTISPGVFQALKTTYALLGHPGMYGQPVTAKIYSKVPGTLVQGLTYYNSPGVAGTINPLDGLVLAEGGKLYTWTTTWSAALTPVTALHDAAVKVVMCQGLDKLLISDGVGIPQIFCGDPTYGTGGYTLGFISCGTAGNTNLPAGATILCWCGGRMFASGYETSATMYPDTILGSNLLAYGAGQWNLTTQSFRIGDGDGQAVVSMLPFQEQIMAVLKDNSIWLLDCNSAGTIPTSPTYNWSASEQGDRIGNGIGCCGRDAACNYMNDILFMSNPTGVHSIQRMQAAAGQYQLTEPLSLPIQPYIDRINWSYAKNIVAIKYKHYAIFFVPIDNSIYNNYALVWNGHLYNPTSGTFGQWTGVFTGWTPTAVCVSRIGKLVQLVIGSQDGSVNYWKDSQAVLTSDATYLDNGVAIPWSVTTRALIFNNPDNPKQLDFWLFRFNAGNALVNFVATLDLADGDIWSTQIASGGAVLPVILPFVLGSVKPVKAYRSSLGWPFCDEAYYKISSPGGWAAIRSITAGAYAQPIRDPGS